MKLRYKKNPAIHFDIKFEKIEKNSKPSKIRQPHKFFLSMKVAEDAVPPLRFRDLQFEESEDGKSTIYHLTSPSVILSFIDDFISNYDIDNQDKVDILAFKDKIIQQYAMKNRLLLAKSKTALTSVGEIRKNPDTPAPSHSVSLLKKNKNNKIQVYKSNVDKKITEIEAFNGLCYRLLLNDRSPKVRCVYNEYGLRDGIISEAILNFQSLHDYYVNHRDERDELQSPSQSDLIKSGIGRILAAAYCEEENDLHGGNIGYDPDLKKAYKIDHDQATWPLTCIDAKKDPDRVETNEAHRNFGLKPTEAFPITQHDLSHFPHLRDATPKNFPDLTDSEILDLKGIENDENFQKDVYLTFLKRIVLSREIYKNAAEATIHSKKLQERFVAHKNSRTTLLKNELVKNENFIRFLIKNPDIKLELLAEFTIYNQEFSKEDKKILRVNLESVSSEFDNIFKEAMPLYFFHKIYQPELEFNFGKQTKWDEYETRKNTTIINYCMHLSLTQEAAVQLFDEQYENWKLNLDPHLIKKNAYENIKQIIEEIVQLDGKLGLFGGEKRIYQDKEIKLPKAAALIFDHCMNEENPYTLFEKIQQEASKALIKRPQTLFNLFNRRQPETTLFYEKILAMKMPIIVPNFEEKNSLDSSNYDRLMALLR